MKQIFVIKSGVLGMLLCALLPVALIAQDDISIDEIRSELARNRASFGENGNGIPDVSEDFDEINKRLVAKEMELLKELQQKDAERRAAAPSNSKNIKQPKEQLISINTSSSEEPIEVGGFTEEMVLNGKGTAKVTVSANLQKNVKKPTIAKKVAFTSDPVTNDVVQRKVPQQTQKVAEAEVITLPAEEQESIAELRQIINQHDVLKSNLDSKNAQLRSLQLENGDLNAKLRARELKLKNLERELVEVRNRLILAETEVERVSGLLQITQRRPQNGQSVQNTRVVAASNSSQVQAERVNARTIVHPKAKDDMAIATVIVDKANLRTGPGANNSPLMTVSKGTRLAIETRNGQWYRVVSPTGARAWIASEVVAFGPTLTSAPTSTIQIKGYDASLEN